MKKQSNHSLLAIAAASLVLATSGLSRAEDPPSAVDIASFRSILGEVEIHRLDRVVSLEQFLEMSRDEETIILDTRSKDAYERKHLAGAVHLNFSDFTTEKLAALIPDKSTRILIYCNNNVEGEPKAFARKMEPLALNIPTFVNLYGYGYRNVYELGRLVSFEDPRWQFEGSDVKE